MKIFMLFIWNKESIYLIGTIERVLAQQPATGWKNENTICFSFADSNFAFLVTIFNNVYNPIWRYSLDEQNDINQINLNCRMSAFSFMVCKSHRINKGVVHKDANVRWTEWMVHLDRDNCDIPCYAMYDNVMLLSLTLQGLLSVFVRSLKLSSTTFF